MKNITQRSILFLASAFFYFLGTQNIYAQPANNLCANAISLTVGAPCTNGTTVAATTTPATDGATLCWGTAASHTVWYQFTTGPTLNTYVISTDNGGTTDTQLKLFTSACTGTLAPPPNCNEDVGPSGTNINAGVITTSTLAASTTYFIEVDVFGSSTGTFCISVNILPDACANAITLVPGADCVTGTNVSSGIAGDGAGVGAASCWTGANAYSNSVFYNFTATNDSMTVSFGNGSLGTSLYGAVYSGACGSLTQLPPTSCVINGNDINVSGLTVGNTYYIMVDGQALTTGGFCISVSSTLPGNNRLVPLVNMSACGLNFAQASQRVTSRYAGLAGTGLPCTLNITGIPATCRVIDKAYLLYETSFTANAPVSSPSVNVTNPLAGAFSYNASLIGRSHQKCWGETGTASYRTDITSSITGNGNYIINTALPANEIDGMTLLIIYRDLSATYEGHLLIDNGIITINSFATPMASHTMTGVNACAASTGTSFLISGDFQFATHTNTATGASSTVPVDNFWNFDQAATNYTLGQPSIAFTTTSNYVLTMDCFSLVATGAYYQTTTCTACNLPLSVSITPTQPTCGLNNGSATANASTGIYGPYAYSWSPGGMTTQTVTGLAPGTYTVTISDPSGCKTATTTVTLNSSSPATASVSPASTSICSGNSTTLTASGGGTYNWNTGATTAAVTVSPTTTTTYTVTVTVATCTATATAVVNVTQPSVASFSYTGTPYCQNAANPSPTFSGGGAAGTFSSTAGLVFVSTATGQVNLSASTPGTYTVTNTIAASGPCPSVTATATITITAVPIATFTYTGTPYCQNAANPSPAFSGGGVAGTFSSTAGLVFVSTATGQVNLSASTAGTYTVTNTIAAAGGCPVVTATATITITALPVATFSFTGTPYCQNAANPSPAFSGGGVAGTFSSTAGLSINASTGVVNLAASTAGTYTVTNTIAATGGCPAVTATSGITITAPQTAAFSYTASPYCQNASNPSPTFSGGGVAGTFSSTAGLSINASTGVVNLAASTAGTYTVTNTIAASGGCPLVTATASITITAVPVAAFSYTGTPYCQNAANPSPVFSGGGIAGTFSSTAGLVFVSAATGQINLAGSTAGTYTVTNTIAPSGGCPAITATSSVTITPVQSAAFSYASATFCQTGTNPAPTITGAAGGTFTSSPAGLVFVSSSTGEINLTGSSLNTYTITYTTAGPCASSATATITITNAPAATFSYTGTPYCQNASDPSPTFSGGGTAGVFSSTAGLVFVSSTSGQVNLAASTAGTYVVTNTIAASGGCSAASATASITINAVQNSGFNYSSPTFCQTGTNPTPTITGVTGGTFSSSPSGLAFVSAATGEINLSGSSLNTYTITYTTAGPCPSSSTATVTISNPTSAVMNYGGPYCQSSTNPSPVFGTGASAGTFSSTAGLVFISTASGQVDLAASTAGTYVITNTIAASGGCPASADTAGITITAPQTAAFSYTGTPYCQNAANPTPTFSGGGVAGVFSASSGALVFVSTSSGQVDLAASTPGTYTVTNTIAASGGCPAVTATANITITAPQVAAFSYTGTPYCQNAANPAPTFSGGGVAGTFSSTAGLIFISTVTGEVDLVSSTPGMYTVTNTIAASGGCPAITATANITIDPVQSAAFSYASSTFCQTGTNPSATITGTAGGSFTSSPAGLVFVSSSTGEINLAASSLNTYTITYTTAGPCADAATATITITTAPVATFSYTGTPYCQNGVNPFPTFSGGGSAGIFSSTAGLVFVSTSTGQVDLTASTPGTYTVTNTIAASGGCSAAAATSTITIDPLQNAGFSYSAGSFCSAGTNPFPAITGTAGGTFSASPAGLIFVSSSTGEIDLAGSALNTYTITYTTPGPCANSSTATVTITNAPAATFSFTGSPYCQGAANPSPVYSGGGTAGTFSSTAGLVFVSTSTGQVDLAASIPGTYTVTNTLAASGGCPAVTATASITITAPQTGAFNYTGTPYCQNATDPSPALSGGSVSGTFTSTAGLIINASTGVVNLAASTPGTYTVTNTIAASGGCPAVTATATITIDPLQNAGFNYSSPAFCQSGTNPIPAITGVAGGTFSSSPAGLVFVNSATGEIDLPASGLNTYTITYTTPGPCANSSTVTVTITASAVATASAANSCEGGTISLAATGGGTYSWTGPNSFSSAIQNPSITNAAIVNSGTYTVTITTGGCTDTAQVAVTVYPLPAASAGSDITISQGASTTLNASGGTSYSWNISSSLSCTACANPTVSPTETTTYCVVVSNGNCTDSACVTVTVETPCPANKELAVPNAFSPNGDGNNDLFCMPGWNGCMDQFSIYIYDRWGEKVFESSDADFCWDGTYRGQTMNPGVLVYYIKATILNGDKVEKKGNISLIQ